MIMISAAKDSLFEIFAINITLVLVSELYMRERKPVNLAIISMADNECYKVRESSQIIIEDSALFSFERCREGSCLDYVRMHPSGEACHCLA